MKLTSMMDMDKLEADICEMRMKMARKATKKERKMREQHELGTVGHVHQWAEERDSYAKFGDVRAYCTVPGCDKKKWVTAN